MKFVVFPYLRVDMLELELIFILVHVQLDSIWNWNLNRSFVTSLSFPSFCMYLQRYVCYIYVGFDIRILGRSLLGRVWKLLFIDNNCLRNRIQIYHPAKRKTCCVLFWTLFSQGSNITHACIDPKILKNIPNKHFNFLSKRRVVTLISLL